MTDRLDDLLFSIGEEQNDRVDFDQMYADLLKKHKEEEKKRSIRRSRFVRYGAMAACAVALVGIGAAMVNSSRPAPEAAIHAPMSDEYAAAAAAEEMHRAYLEGCVGMTYPVLFEQPKNGKFSGHAPNYMEVLAEGENLHNRLLNVTITAVEGDALLGKIQEEQE